ncbi:MAG: YfhO family protein, partial [Oscillospiraceae bacterium]
WLAALFPVSISQYLMAPLLALKIALCSLFAFIYIRRFVTNPDNALIGGILYAFSGFSLYNIFFNHFHEAIVFFPLLLIGLEEAVVNKRRGAFAVAVAINALVNYFFFIGECIFLVLYFIVRLCMSREFRINVRDFFCLAGESILGVMLAGILFVPSIYQVLDVPRSTQILNGWNFLFYGNQSRYGLILEGMFFPPEIPARTNMFTEANAKWSSVALYLPLFSMAGVIAFVKDAKKHWARVLLPICLVMSLVPGLNAAFVLFNNNFYTRWFYMPELICCLATVYTLEHNEIDLKFGWKACCIVSGLMTALVLLFPMTRTTEIKNDDGVTEKVKDIVPRILNDFNPAVLINIALCAGMLVILGVVIHHRKKVLSSVFRERILTVTIICSMMLGYYFVAYGRILGPYIGSYNKSLTAKIDIDDIEFYRIEAPDEMNNVNMLWNMSSLQSFTSIIPSSTFELYDLLDIERTVNSKPETTHYALRSLTRVKYLILPKDYLEVKREGVLEDLRTFSFLKAENGYEIYENEYVMPMGTAYDEYVLTDDVKKASQGELLMIGSVALTDEQAEKFSDLLTPVKPEEVRDSTLTFDRFKTEVAERNELAVIQFSVNNSGFTAMTNYDRERLVAFSVPYDSGWSAKVSGEPVEIEKVNGGFMGIRVGAGVKEIEFTYTTPGLSLGIILT